MTFIGTRVKLRVGSSPAICQPLRSLVVVGLFLLFPAQAYAQAAEASWVVTHREILIQLWWLFAALTLALVVWEVTYLVARRSERARALVATRFQARAEVAALTGDDDPFKTLLKTRNNADQSLESVGTLTRGRDAASAQGTSGPGASASQQAGGASPGVPYMPSRGTGLPPSAPSPGADAQTPVTAAPPAPVSVSQAPPWQAESANPVAPGMPSQASPAAPTPPPATPSVVPSPVPRKIGLGGTQPPSGAPVPPVVSEMSAPQGLASTPSVSGEPLQEGQGTPSISLAGQAPVASPPSLAAPDGLRPSVPPAVPPPVPIVPRRSVALGGTAAASTAPGFASAAAPPNDPWKRLASAARAESAAAATAPGPGSALASTPSASPPTTVFPGETPPLPAPEQASHGRAPELAPPGVGAELPTTVSAPELDSVAPGAPVKSGPPPTPAESRVDADAEEGNWDRGADDLKRAVSTLKLPETTPVEVEEPADKPVAPPVERKRGRKLSLGAATPDTSTAPPSTASEEEIPEAIRNPAVAEPTEKRRLLLRPKTTPASAETDASQV